MYSFVLAVDWAIAKVAPVAEVKATAWIVLICISIYVSSSSSKSMGVLVIILAEISPAIIIIVDFLILFHAMSVPHWLTRYHK